jgi:hypothetical protein
MAYAEADKSVPPHTSYNKKDPLARALTHGGSEELTKLCLLLADV